MLAGDLAMFLDLLHADREREPLLCAEKPMTTPECIAALFSHVDEQLRTVSKHPEARLWPSEVVTLGLLHGLKGGGNGALYRWLSRDYRALFPRFTVPSKRGIVNLTADIQFPGISLGIHVPKYKGLADRSSSV
jgi:hypothetical protein